MYESQSLYLQAYAFFFFVIEKTKYQTNRKKRIIYTNRHWFFRVRQYIINMNQNCIPSYFLIIIVGFLCSLIPICPFTWSIRCIYVNIIIIRGKIVFTGRMWVVARRTYRFTCSLPCSWDVSPKFLPKQTSTIRIMFLQTDRKPMIIGAATLTTKEAITPTTNITISRITWITISVFFVDQRSLIDLSIGVGICNNSLISGKTRIVGLN